MNGSDDSDAKLFKAVGERIALLRKQAGMTQQEFAAAAGVSNKYAWRVEDGRQNLSLRSLARFAVALDLPMAALLKGVEADPAVLSRRSWIRKDETTS